MEFLYVIAVVLVLATVAVSLVTGQRLGERRKAVFRMEMAAEELRRRVADMEDGKRKADGLARALRRLRQDKQETISALRARLRELEAEDGREIGVSLGLRQASFELEAA